MIATFINEAETGQVGEFFNLKGQRLDRRLAEDYHGQMQKEMSELIQMITTREKRLATWQDKKSRPYFRAKQVAMLAKKMAKKD